jgi:hypothetical protein
MSRDGFDRLIPRERSSCRTSISLGPCTGGRSGRRPPWSLDVPRTPKPLRWPRLIGRCRSPKQMRLAVLPRAGFRAQARPCWRRWSERPHVSANQIAVGHPAGRRVSAPRRPCRCRRERRDHPAIDHRQAPTRMRGHQCAQEAWYETHTWPNRPSSTSRIHLAARRPLARLRVIRTITPAASPPAPHYATNRKKAPLAKFVKIGTTCPAASWRCLATWTRRR